MPELIIFTGIPGSGKSTVANNVISRGYNHQLICLDDIRLALGAVYEPKTEPVVKMVLDVMANAFAERGLNIIVDGNILYSFLYEKWERFCKEYNYDLRVVYIDTPVDECIRRRKDNLDSNIILDYYDKTMDLLDYFKENKIEYRTITYERTNP